MVGKLLGYLRRFALLGAVVAAGLTWANTFKSSWASKDWTGLWSSDTELRGTTVKITEKDVETTAERQKREGEQLKTGLVDDLRGVKRDMLGDKHVLRGKDIGAPAIVLPPGHADYTQREVCFLQKAEFPERFKDLDCMSEKFDSEAPWLEAPGLPHGE